MRNRRQIRFIREHFLTVAGVFSTGIGTLFGITWGKSWEERQIAYLFCIVLIAAGGILVLVYRHTALTIRSFLYDNLREARARRAVSSRDLELEIYKGYVAQSDRAFRDLALDRISFDNKIFLHAYAPLPEGTSDEIDYRLGAMVEDVDEYLEQVCEAIVKIFSSRKQTERDAFHVNIRNIKLENGTYKYRTAARSKNTPEERRRNDNLLYDISSSKRFTQAEKEQTRTKAIPDIKTYIDEYLEAGETTIGDPHPSIRDVYKSSLSALIYLSPRSQFDLILGEFSRNAYKSERNDLIFGMITIDSPDYIFRRDNREDRDIMKEASIYALSAMKMYDNLRNILESR